MKLVVITLDDNDDAQVIFETLNSQGQPLLAMDLVRNNIFHRAEAQKESAEVLYATLWESFDQQWWRDYAPRAMTRSTSRGSAGCGSVPQWSCRR
jgi:uncharacterized protein with ParB-like and HNH nuclease domain